MADQIAQAIPERPKDTPADEAGAVAPAEGEKGPSKGALKKAAKEKEKVRYGLWTTCNDMSLTARSRLRRQLSARPPRRHRKKSRTPTMFPRKTTASCP
jgi:flagellar hook-length control protein FliK